MQQLLLAHKYGMTKIVSDVEVILLEALQHMLSRPTVLIGLSDLILQIHSAAEQLVVIIELSALGSTLQDMCETMIAVYFDHYSSEKCALASKLSSASMLRVAKKAHALQSQATEAIRSALMYVGRYANIESRDYNEFVATHVDFNLGRTMKFPACGVGLLLVTQYNQDGHLHYENDDVVRHVQSGTGMTTHCAHYWCLDLLISQAACQT